MIKNMAALNMQETKKILGSSKQEDEEKKKAMETFIKKFSKISNEKAEKIKKGLEGLGLLKLKKSHIAKIVDILPEDGSDLNKIFLDITLNEDETNKILEVVKNNR